MEFCVICNFCAFKFLSNEVLETICTVTGSESFAHGRSVRERKFLTITNISLHIRLMLVENITKSPSRSYPKVNSVQHSIYL